MMKRIVWAMVLGAVTLGCSDKPVPEEAQPMGPSKEAIAKGEDILRAVGGPAAEHYRAVCSTCHGISGMGDGPSARGVQPSPKNFTDGRWQEYATDEAIAKIIVEGGRAVGKSPLMMANPDLKAKPEVLAGLVRIVRLYGPQKPPAVAPTPAPAPPAPIAPPKAKEVKGAQIDGSAPNTPRVRTADEKARHVYRTQCAYCHGADGAGNGPTAVTLKTKPRSFRSKEWQEKTGDERIRTVIVSGGASVGLSAEMPPHGGLKRDREVLAELVQVIRSMRAY